MKNVKRILCLVLALMMVAALVACGPKEPTPPATDNGTTPPTESGSASSLPSYLQVGQMPLVTEDITLRIAVVCDDVNTKPEDSWMMAFLQEKLGIKVKLETFYESTREENLSLMMNDGNLPDIMIGLGFDTVKLTRYGEIGEQLLDLAPYLNEENAPNIMAVAKEYPAYLKSLTNANGQVFSIGNFSERIDNSGCLRMFYNYDIMEKAGVTKVPETLDEFVEMLRTIKKYSDANDLGIVPFGGNFANHNGTYLILNALGFNYSTGASEACQETNIALRDGEVVLTCYDQEAFPKYLEVMHTLHSEGLMEEDFYTLEKDTTRAHLSAGKYAVFSQVPGLYGGVEFNNEWWGGVPLTSEFNDTPFWPNYGYTSVGNFVVSADTEYPELCVALADFFFSPDPAIHRLVNLGPSVKQEDLFLDKTTGWYWDDDPEHYGYNYAGFDADPEKYGSVLNFRTTHISLWKNLSFYAAYRETEADENLNSKLVEFVLPETDVKEMADNNRKTYGNFNDHWQYSQNNTWGRYITDEMSPRVCYFDQETTDRIADLYTLIRDHASNEIAKFITGKRDLSEINDYFNELKGLGADEYVKIYADYYAANN